MLHGNIPLVYPKGMKLIKQKYVCNMVSQNWNIVIMHNLCFASICISLPDQKQMARSMYLPNSQLNENGGKGWIKRLETIIEPL